MLHKNMCQEFVWLVALINEQAITSADPQSLLEELQRLYQC